MIWYIVVFGLGQASILGIQWTMLRNSRPPKKLTHMYDPSDY